MLHFVRNYESIKAFTKVELNFTERIFLTNAAEYVFFGERVTPELSHRILKKYVMKIAGSGHYLLNGESYNYYQQIHQDLGHRLLLTSGIRDVVKQIHLFMGKIRRSE